MEKIQHHPENVLYTSVKQLIGCATSIAPEEIIQQVSERKKHYPSGTASTPHAVTDIVHDKLLYDKGIEIDRGLIFLQYALVDIQKCMIILKEKYPDIDDEHITEIMADPESIEMVALLALRSNEQMNTYIQEELPRYGMLSPVSSSFIIMDSELHPSYHRGCPAAGSKEHGITPTPLFKKLVPWAAQVIVHSDEWKIYTNSAK